MTFDRTLFAFWVYEPYLRKPIQKSRKPVDSSRFRRSYGLRLGFMYLNQASKERRAFKRRLQKNLLAMAFPHYWGQGGVLTTGFPWLAWGANNREPLASAMGKAPKTRATWTEDEKKKMMGNPLLTTQEMSKLVPSKTPAQIETWRRNNRDDLARQW